MASVTVMAMVMAAAKPRTLLVGGREVTTTLINNDVNGGSNGNGDGEGNGNSGGGGAVATVTASFNLRHVGKLGESHVAPILYGCGEMLWVTYVVQRFG